MTEAGDDSPFKVLQIMAPRDEGGGAIDVDWDWIDGLDPKNLDDEDIGKLVPILSDCDPDPERVNHLFLLAARALKSRDSDLTEAIEELKVKDEEMEEEKTEMKKENKELKAQVKKLKKAKSATGDEALEVTFGVLLANGES